MKPSLIYELDRLVNGRDDSPITRQELSSSPVGEALGGLGFFAKSLGVSPEELSADLERGELSSQFFATEMGKLTTKMWRGCPLVDIVSELCETYEVRSEFSIKNLTSRPSIRIEFDHPYSPVIEIDKSILQRGNSDAYSIVKRFLELGLFSHQETA
jgi:hypothetical protein